MRYAFWVPALVLFALGCNREPTQVVVGVVTNLSAPDALDEVQMTVLRQGVEVLRHDWTIPGQAAQPYELPGSFVIFSPSGAEAQVEVTVRGIKGQREVVRRRSVFSLVREQTLFVRMALVQRCEAMSCAAGQTCVEGRCQAAEFSSRRFPRYQAGMERAAMCKSGTVFRHTVTRAELPVWGAGACAASEECIEATCYLREESNGGDAAVAPEGDGHGSMSAQDDLRVGGQDDASVGADAQGMEQDLGVSGPDGS
jgi:hypothetical protein